MGFCTPEQPTRFLKVVPLVERAIVESGIILLKYWLEVSPEEQTRRLKSRFEDGRKVWKLSPMDLKSYSRWYDYSRARDAMFAATDTNFAPWRVAPSDRKKSVRLNIISDILKRVPYKELPREKLKLPPGRSGRLRRPGLPAQGHRATLLSSPHRAESQSGQRHRRGRRHPARRAFGAPAVPPRGRRSRAPADIRAIERRRPLHALHAGGSRARPGAAARGAGLVSGGRNRHRGHRPCGRRNRHRRQCDRHLRADRATCEFAITVVSEFGGSGLATRLMTTLIDEAKRRGQKEMEGLVLKQNQSMLRLAKRLGFRVESDPDDPTVRWCRLSLAG
jgi:GNAT superfamily N-acetyltransferase